MLSTALLLLSACGTATIQQPSNAATNDAVNEVAANIAEHDGAVATTAPVDANDVGQTMRTAPARPPKP